MTMNADLALIFFCLFVVNLNYDLYQFLNNNKTHLYNWL